MNIWEAEEVIDLAVSLGAFRFNTGQLMRLGTAAKLWDRLEPSKSEYSLFLSLLERKEWKLKDKIELCYKPFSIADEMAHRAIQPSGTLLILPDGRVKVAAPLPWTCADLKTQNFLQAWESYKNAWADPRVRASLKNLAADPSSAAKANEWVSLETSHNLPAMV